MLENTRADLKKWLPFAILGILVFLVHFMAARNLGGDDVKFFGIFTSHDFNYLGFLRDRYVTWSSRLLIESAMIPAILMPRLVWMVADSLVFTFLGVLIYKLINPRHFRFEIAWVVALMLLMFNYHDITDTGWITTTLNYLWPLTAALWVIEPFVDVNRCSRMHPARLIVTGLFALFASNMELVCFMLVAVSGAYLLYWAIRRRFVGYALLVFIISAASMVFIFTCPGNTARFANDAQGQFLSLGYLQKLEIGISLVVSKLLLVPDILFIFVCFLSGIILQNDRKTRIAGVIAMVPFFFAIALVAMYFLGTIASLEHDKVRMIMDGISKWGIALAPAPGSRIMMFSAAILFLSVIMLLLLATNFLLIFGKTIEGFVAVGALALGVATKAILGFSPTAWASGVRTSLMLSMSLVFLFGYLLKRWDFSNKLASRILMLLIAGGAFGEWIFNSSNLISFRALF